jgi:NAD(P)-dependent dehydrogenase (short-subunit alcohol dehydrogenase family)
MTTTRGAVLVTGCSSGIGRATAPHLAARGHTISAGLRRMEEAEELARAPGRIVPVLLDVTDPASVEFARDRVVAECGAAGLLAVVNNAGRNLAAAWETRRMSRRCACSR